MRVFITRAAGFIGAATTRELIANGYEVLGLARSEANAKALAALGAEIHRGPLEDPTACAEARRKPTAPYILLSSTISRNSRRTEKSIKRAIDAMGNVLAGSNKPFIVTSGTLLIAPGWLATEQDP